MDEFDASTSQNDITPFVEDWDIVQTLGEGAFGEVKLLVHRKTNDAIAVKIVDLSLPECKETTRKEVLILRMLKHENVINFIGQRMETDFHYVFLEYAAGGELFDRIEPDVGMPELEAQHYFRQLVNGTEYLHSRGVAHRDLKPENLLLTDTETISKSYLVGWLHIYEKECLDVLKISDFGMATIFRHRGEERLLNKRCGTLPYVSPEVIFREYRAEPADVWSCGIVLVALLAGELPWDSPSSNCSRFITWREGEGWRKKPFTKVDNVALSLLRSVLNCNSEQRATIERIKVHQWFVKDFTRKKLLTRTISGEEAVRGALKRFRSNCRLENRPKADLEDENARISFSQPEASLSFDGGGSHQDCLFSSSQRAVDEKNCGTEWSSNEAKDITFSFSQPARLENLLINTQSQSSQAALNPLQKLVKRMTRFFVKISLKEALFQVENLCTKAGYSTKKTTAVQLTVFTVDTRRNNLSFKVNAYEMNRKVLIEFRLSKGDGLEFKRIFVRLRDKLKMIIDHAEIDSWSFAELHYKNTKGCPEALNSIVCANSSEILKITEQKLSLTKQILPRKSSSRTTATKRGLLFEN